MRKPTKKTAKQSPAIRKAAKTLKARRPWPVGPDMKYFLIRNNKGKYFSAEHGEFLTQRRLFMESIPWFESVAAAKSVIKSWQLDPATLAIESVAIVHGDDIDFG